MLNILLFALIGCGETKPEDTSSEPATEPANEVAVEKFLNDDIGFLEMSDLIADCMHKVSFIEKPSYEDYVHSDLETRELAKALKY